VKQKREKKKEKYNKKKSSVSHPKNNKRDGAGVVF